MTVTGLGASMVADQADADNALVLPGVSGNYASAPHSVPLSITGDIDIRVRVALDDWTPAGFMDLVNKAQYVGQYGYQFYVRNGGAGTLSFTYTNDGTTQRKNIFIKLGVNDRRAAVRRAVELDLL